MRVLLITMHLPLAAENINGGVGAAIYNLIPGFSEINSVELHILSFNQDIKVYIKNKITENITIHFIPYCLFGHNKIDFILTSFFSFNKFLKIIKPDIIHYQMHGAFLCMRLLLKFRNKKEIITFHGLSKEEAKHSSKVSIKLLYRFNEYINHFLLPSNAIFISNYSKKYYSSYKFKNQTTIFNSVNNTFFCNEIKKDNNNNLLYIGYIYPLKNLLFILEVLNNLKKEGLNHKLHIVGCFRDTAYELMISEFIKNSELKSDIIFYGIKTQNEINQIIKKIDTLIVASKHENLPVVIAEGMASGKTIVASAVGGIPEMIQHNISGYLFESENKHSLESILRRIHNNKLTEIQQEAKMFAMNNFNSLKNAENALNFYKLL